MNEKKEHPSPDELQAYLDGELELHASEKMTEHLKTCEACQSELSLLDSLIARLESLEELPLEKDLSLAILGKIQQRRQIPQGLTWTLLVEGIAAGVVIGLLIPVIRSTVWIPRLIDTQLEVRAAINIFMTQFASNWTFWWAQLQFDFSQIIGQISGPISLPKFWPSPWILVLAGVGVGLLGNFILLRNSIQARNGQNKD